MKLAKLLIALGAGLLVLLVLVVVVVFVSIDKIAKGDVEKTTSLTIKGN